MFNGDNSEDMKINKAKWRAPIISLHHEGKEEMTSLWEWEMSRPYNKVGFLHFLLMITGSSVANQHLQ